MDYSFFSSLFEENFRRLVLYGRGYVGSEEQAKDIVQDCFVRLWRMRGEIDRKTARSLVFMMVRNDCLNALKHKAVVSNFEKESILKESGRDYVFSVDFCETPETMGLFAELASIIRSEVEKLPSRCREVFLLSRYHGMRNNEIASYLGISEPAVHKHLVKAIEKLKKIIDY